MVSPGKGHCAISIGAVSFPTPASHVAYLRERAAVAVSLCIVQRPARCPVTMRTGSSSKFDRRRRGRRTGASHQRVMGPAERDWCVRRLQHDHALPLGSLTYRQAALIVALLSTVRLPALATASAYRPIGRYRRSKHTKSMAPLKLVVDYNYFESALQSL